MTAGYLTVSKRFVTLSRVLSSFLSSAIFIITLQCWALFFTFITLAAFSIHIVPMMLEGPTKNIVSPCHRLGSFTPTQLVQPAILNAQSHIESMPPSIPEHDNPPVWPHPEIKSLCLVPGNLSSLLWKSAPALPCLELYIVLSQPLWNTPPYGSPKGRDPITTKLLKQAF